MTIFPGPAEAVPWQTEIPHEGWSEVEWTIPGIPSAVELRERLEGFHVTGADLFGTPVQLGLLSSSLDQAGCHAPRTAIVSTSSQCAALQIHAVTGLDPLPVLVQGKLVGFAFDSGEARWAYLSGLLPTEGSCPPGEQTESVFANINIGLAAAGLSFQDVVRTWFYNDDILAWYDAFNQVRSRYFIEHNISRMPASTGIGAPNGSGAALVAKAFAMRPRGEAVSIEAVSSPLQCEANNYGSAFSRAIRVDSPSGGRLFVSGTASIEPGGRTIHPGNSLAQINTTLDVVEALLADNNTGFSDVTRAILYFRNLEDRAVWEKVCARRGIPPLPSVVLECFVCREDLLFEIELDATIPQETRGGDGLVAG
jgi:enamine deaminase RidA (YjgF/YER057c/UK114 family)